MYSHTLEPNLRHNNGFVSRKLGLPEHAKVVSSILCYELWRTENQTGDLLEDKGGLGEIDFSDSYATH